MPVIDLSLDTHNMRRVANVTQRVERMATHNRRIQKPTWGRQTAPMFLGKTVDAIASGDSGPVELTSEVEYGGTSGFAPGFDLGFGASATTVEGVDPIILEDVKNLSADLEAEVECLVSLVSVRGAAEARFFIIPLVAAPPAAPSQRNAFIIESDNAAISTASTTIVITKEGQNRSHDEIGDAKITWDNTNGRIEFDVEGWWNVSCWMDAIVSGELAFRDRHAEPFMDVGASFMSGSTLWRSVAAVSNKEVNSAVRFHCSMGSRMYTFDDTHWIDLQAGFHAGQTNNEIFINAFFLQVELLQDLTPTP